MAPIVAALAGAGFAELWRMTEEGRAWPLAATIGLTGWWATVILGRTPDFLPWLRAAIAAAAAISTGVLLLSASAGGVRAAAVSSAAALGVAAVLAGPTAYAIDTLGTSFTGGDPKAGPTAELPLPAALAAPQAPGGTPAPGGAAGPTPDRPADRPLQQDGPDRPTAVPGNPNDLLDDALVRYLSANRGDTTWLAAAANAHVSAPLMLVTGEPVMTMGGFGGRDPALEVDDLARFVADGELRYVIQTSGAGPQSENPARTRWLAENCRVVDPSDYGGPERAAVTLYDCAAA
jgi:hypothetical protein